jgi:hypothetical protein
MPRLLKNEITRARERVAAYGVNDKVYFRNIVRRAKRFVGLPQAPLREKLIVAAQTILGLYQQSKWFQPLDGLYRFPPLLVYRQFQSLSQWLCLSTENRIDWADDEFDRDYEKRVVRLPPNFNLLMRVYKLTK